MEAESVFLPPIRGRAASSALALALARCIVHVITLISSAHACPERCFVRASRKCSPRLFIMLQGLASFSRKYNQNGRRCALYYVYFHENITKTGCCTFYAQLWNGPRELLIRLDGFKAVGGANEKL